MNTIAKALYTAAMAQNDETLALIERRYGKGENYIKTCREMHISPTTYYRILSSYKDKIIGEYQKSGIITTDTMIKF